jgi:hypothetical protein
MDIFSEKACFKKPVLPEKSVKKPAFNLPVGFFNKTWVFSSPGFNTPHLISKQTLLGQTELSKFIYLGPKL